MKNAEHKNKEKTVEYEQVSSRTFKPKRKSGIGHFVLSPIDWASKGFKWITHPTSQGGGQYLMKAAAIILFGLTIENSYDMLDSRPNSKFIPKPLVSDNARIERVLPLGSFGNGVAGALSTLPRLAGIRNTDGTEIQWKPFGEPDFNVWSDTNFYIAFLIAAGMNTIEAMFFRRVRLEVRQRQHKQAVKTDEQISQTLSYAEKKAEIKRLETKLREGQIKHYGDGSIVFNAIIIVIVYIAEGKMFLSSFAPGTSFLVTVVYGALSVFGSEVFWALGESMEDRQESED